MMAKVLRLAFNVAVYCVCIITIASWPLRIARKALFGRRMNSYWSGTPIINMAINARAERLLGANAKSIVYRTYFITNAFDVDLSRTTAVPVLGRLVPLAVFWWAAVTADRLHFYCDRGFLPSRGWFTFDFRELWIYRLLGIPVLLWTYGADIRGQSACRSMGEPNCCTDCDQPGKYCVCDDELQRENVQRLGKLSRAIFAGMGDMFPFTPGSVDDTFFWPVDLEAENGTKYRPEFPDNDGSRPLRVVHACNHRMFKGTRYLIDAVDRLAREGVAIDLVLVEGVPNREALDLYRSADLIFDNCLMGSIGYFGLEAMALGKPVMCFVRHPERYLLAPEECPVINARATTLTEDLRRVIDEPERLAELGRRGRAYVEKHFSLEAFAERLRLAYARLGVGS